MKPLVKIALDSDGRAHLTALINGQKLILRHTEDGEVRGNIEIALTAELRAFFRDLSIIIEGIMSSLSVNLRAASRGE